MRGRSSGMLFVKLIFVQVVNLQEEEQQLCLKDKVSDGQQAALQSEAKVELFDWCVCVKGAYE